MLDMICYEENQPTRGELELQFVSITAKSH
jgi:hypothetical protein